MLNTEGWLDANQVRLENFISLASPHLGIRETTAFWTWFTGLAATGRDLAADTPTLLNLCDDEHIEALAKFRSAARRHVLIGSKRQCAGMTMNPDHLACGKIIVSGGGVVRAPPPPKKNEGRGIWKRGSHARRHVLPQRTSLNPSEDQQWHFDYMGPETPPGGPGWRPGKGLGHGSRFEGGGGGRSRTWARMPPMPIPSICVSLCS